MDRAQCEYPQDLDDWEASNWEAFYSESEPELPGDAVGDDGYEDASRDLVGVAEAGTSGGGTGEHGSDSPPALTPDEWVDWHFDDSGYYAYITLNGTRELVQRWVTALHDAGWPCLANRPGMGLLRSTWLTGGSVSSWPSSKGAIRLSAKPTP